MVKKTIPQKVKKEINEYIKILKTDKLPIKKVILFGSFAKGKQHKWSDIDLCVISPKFKILCRIWHSATDPLSLKKPFNTKYALGPIGFSPEYFKDKYSSLIYEIKTTGIEIQI
ncbi:MAG: nucleotidyltransferase domain-containing protein [Patescibacteria group bacterium]